MTKTDFYNLSQPQQKAERFRQYAEFFNTKTNDYENNSIYKKDTSDLRTMPINKNCNKRANPTMERTQFSNSNARHR